MIFPDLADSSASKPIPLDSGSFFWDVLRLLNLSDEVASLIGAPNNALRWLMSPLFLVAALGCTRDAWNLDRYRDERAMDIDTRLSSDEPIVKNPFSQEGAVQQK